MLQYKIPIKDTRFSSRLCKVEGWEKCRFNCWGLGGPALAIVLREYIWNAHAVSLVLPTFGDTIPLVPPWVTVEGNREAELKPTTFSSRTTFP